jgi:hypothetical protein
MAGAMSMTAVGMAQAGARLYAISVSPFAGQVKSRSWKATTNHDGTVRPKGPGGVPV